MQNAFCMSAVPLLSTPFSSGIDSPSIPLVVLNSLNELPNLAQIFTEKRYKKADNEFFSEKFMNTLKKQGFI